MSKKDGVSREFFKDNNRFADAFNFHMYNGEKVIKPEDLEEKDVTEVLKVYQLDEKGSTIGDMIQRWRDMIMDALNYGSQVNEAAKRHRAEKDTKSSAEFLSAFVSDYKMNLIVPSEIDDFQNKLLEQYAPEEAKN